MATWRPVLFSNRGRPCPLALPEAGPGFLKQPIRANTLRERITGNVSPLLPQREFMSKKSVCKLCPAAMSPSLIQATFLQAECTCTEGSCLAVT